MQRKGETKTQLDFVGTISTFAVSRQVKETDLGYYVRMLCLRYAMSKPSGQAACAFFAAYNYTKETN